MTGIALHPSWLLLVAAVLSGPASEPPVWWQFVMNGPNAERQVSPHFQSKQECNAALKATESSDGEAIPTPLPAGRKLRALCQASLLKRFPRRHSSLAGRSLR